MSSKALILGALVCSLSVCTVAQISKPQFVPVPPPVPPTLIAPGFNQPYQDMQAVPASTTSSLTSALQANISAAQKGQVPPSVASSLQATFSNYVTALVQANYTAEMDSIAANNPNAVLNATPTLAQAQAVVTFLNSLGFTGYTAQSFLSTMENDATNEALLSNINTFGTANLLSSFAQSLGSGSSRLRTSSTMVYTVYTPKESHAKLLLINKPAECGFLATLALFLALTGDEPAAAAVGWAMYMDGC